MSQYGLFWDSKNGDRVYNAASMEEWLKPFFVTGVFNGQLQVTAESGMNISVAAGYANINGKVAHFESSTALTIDITSGVEDRIDAVVIERNDSDRLFSIKVVKGTEAAEPVAPEPVRTATVYQLVLAHIFVGRGATAITQADITDKRTDSDLCGYVVATVNEIDFSQIVAQWDAYISEFKADREDSFDEWVAANEEAYSAWITANQTAFMNWFANIQYVLDGDVAGHLQNEIDDLQNDVAENADGFKDATTVFNEDGSITVTYSNRIKNIIFGENTITETLTDPQTQYVYSTKTTTFNDDGSITETVL